jgi:hypothetical protein
MAAISPREWALLLFGLSVMVNLGRLSGAALGWGFEPLAVARSIATGHGFSDPFYPFVTGPTAHPAPLYPALLGGIMFLLGIGSAAAIVVVALELTWHGISVALLPAISKDVFGDPLAGYLAAMVMIASRIAPVTPQVETSFTAFLLVAFTAAALRGRLWAAAGLLGAIGLTNPTGVLAVLPFPLYRLGRRRTAMLMVGAAAICIPWVVRNRVVMGAWIPVRDNFGLELSLANDDCAGVRSATNRCLALTYPYTRADVAAQLAREGEARYYQGRAKQAVRWIGGHPQRFFELTAARVGEFWFPHEDTLVSVLTAVAFAGLWLARHRRAFPPLVAAFCGFPLPYYVVAAELRRRAPVLWMTALAAGYALAVALAYGCRARQKGCGRSEQPPLIAVSQSSERTVIVFSGYYGGNGKTCCEAGRYGRYVFNWRQRWMRLWRRAGGSKPERGGMGACDWARVALGMRIAAARSLMRTIVRLLARGCGDRRRLRFARIPSVIIRLLTIYVL